jgi:gliding motility-associated-like protein
VISVNSPTVCSGQPVTLVAGGATTYSWSLGAMPTGVNTATASPIAFTTYTVTGTTNGCSATAVSSVSVNTLPSPSFVADHTNGCVPLCIQFTDVSSSSCNSISYNFGDGGTSNSSDPQHCFIASGSYSISISCMDINGCIGTTTIPNMITVGQMPEAEFSIDPSASIITNTPVVFTDLSTFGGTQLWNFGDTASGLNNSSVLSIATHVYNDPGNYCITLFSSNSDGCKDTASQCIDIIAEASVAIPNIFTPNGDGVNDQFFITTVAIKELSCSIYDRWGLKIAEWEGINGFWDGRTTSGGIAPDGVYYYMLKYIEEGINAGEIIEKQGFVQLFQKK